MLPQADYAGSVSGLKEDKSGLFAYEMGEGGTPVITSAPLTMECTVEDVYNTPNFESFICKIDSTYVEEDHLNEAGKINYQTLKPVLFEFPTYEYLKTGSVTSFTRMSIYNYFQTKEEIFLALLEREYELWVAELQSIMDENESLDRQSFADKIAGSLDHRRQLLKIMSMNMYDIEENSRIAMGAWVWGDTDGYFGNTRRLFLWQKK